MLTGLQSKSSDSPPFLIEAVINVALFCILSLKFVSVMCVVLRSCTLETMLMLTILHSFDNALKKCCCTAAGGCAYVVIQV